MLSSTRFEQWQFWWQETVRARQMEMAVFKRYSFKVITFRKVVFSQIRAYFFPFRTLGTMVDDSELRPVECARSATNSLTNIWSNVWSVQILMVILEYRILDQ